MIIMHFQIADSKGLKDYTNYSFFQLYLE